jgi:anti-sigma regulatory factor (Ser/Thr protein kinase)
MSKFFFSMPSCELALKASDDMFGALIAKLDIDDAEKHRLRIIVSELFTNAYLHGNNADPKKYIDLTLEFGDGDFTAVAKDQGTGMPEDMLRIQTQADPESEHGRGLKIMHKLGDKIDISTDNDGRFCVKVTKKITAANKTITAAIKR